MKINNEIELDKSVRKLYDMIFPMKQNITFMKGIMLEIKWAIIFSLTTLMWMVLEKMVGLHGKYIDYHVYLTNLFAVPAIIVMVKALKDKKKWYYSGQMTYKQGLISGMVLSVIIALFSPITQWITSYMISPEFFPNVIKRSVELNYYKTTEEAEAYFNFQNYATQGLMAALVFGFITTFLAMIFLQTKRAR